MFEEYLAGRFGFPELFLFIYEKHFSKSKHPTKYPVTNICILFATDYDNTMLRILLAYALGMS